MSRAATLVMAAIAVCAALIAHGADNPAEAVELGRVDVIGTTPVAGLGVPIDRVPANVQVMTRDARDRSFTIPGFLDRNAAGAIASSGQGNAFQPDLAYRGFIASPLLGLPQGLGVFQDGVRLNEPFGDVVNWDLLPMSAIASTQLVPGTTPIFGPNTLGGALAMYTKSGTQFPGGALEVSSGSWGRRTLEIEHGGARGPWDWFATANFANERGWNDHNPSRIAQLFAKGGYQTEASDLDVTLTVADNRLEGAQALPVSFLDNVRQAYTWPDVNVNRVAMLALKGSRFVADGVLLGGSAYVRRYRHENVSSNVNADDAGSGAPATNDRATIDQGSGGAALQLTDARAVGGHENQWSIGATADAGRARFSRFAQPATFTDSRGTEAIGDFVAGTDADTRTGHYGVFATDTFSATREVALTLSARHDTTRLAIEDRSGQDPQLAGSHRFGRLNPAAGINFTPAATFTLYANYSEGMRAPTAMEVTCADPQAPCKLPNAFLADPPLRAIVARTVESGARGRWGEQGAWSAAAFRTTVSDDIQFVASGVAGSNAGFFRNVGETRRAGLELSVADGVGRWHYTLRYGFVDATFQSPFNVHSPENSSAGATGDILVTPGERLPNIPRHSAKLRLDYTVGERWSAGLTVRAASSAFVRGDENNRDARGPLPGYAVVDASARCTPWRDVDVLLWIENVLDRRYAGQGLLGANVFNGPGHTFDPGHPLAEQFRGMGAPRGLWLALRWRWP